MSHESQEIYLALQKCLELRDKYMAISLQRLGDNPKDYDGVYQATNTEFKPWRIYPKPPPPRWHWYDKQKAQPGKPPGEEEEEFDFGTCEIPGKEEGFTFKLDKTGVYQVYGSEGVSCLFSVL